MQQSEVIYGTDTCIIHCALVRISCQYLLWESRGGVKSCVEIKFAHLDNLL